LKNYKFRERLYTRGCKKEEALSKERTLYSRYDEDGIARMARIARAEERRRIGQENGSAATPQMGSAYG
jgi:hypothetical protein